MEGDEERAFGRSLPPLAWLQTFTVTVRSGGIRSAGRRLGVHHSVISRQITQLEAWLGMSLRQAESRQFALTADGAKYYDRIATPLAEIAGATIEVMDQRVDPALRIWCSPGLSVQWLASRVAEFRTLHPAHLIEMKPSERPANLKAYEADANLYLHLNGQALPSAEPAVTDCELARPMAMIAASPALLEQLPPIHSARDLLDCPLLHAGQRDEWKLWFELNGLQVTAEVPGELCWDPHMALEAARLGRGILLGNPLFFERSFARSELVEVPLPGLREFSLGSYVLSCREDRWSAPAMVALRRFLRARMQAAELREQQ